MEPVAIPKSIDDPIHLLLWSGEGAHGTPYAKYLYDTEHNHTKFVFRYKAAVASRFNCHF